MNKKFRVWILSVLFVLLILLPGQAPVSARPIDDPDDGDGWMEVFSDDGQISRIPAPPADQRSLSVASESTASDVKMVEVNGPSANRIDFVFIGDGYTAGEMTKYSSDVQSKWDFLFSLEPYKTYRQYFNAHQVDVVSAVSGVTNDPKGTIRSTPLLMEFWCAGVERRLCINLPIAWSYAQQAPAVEFIIALANSNSYGGAGYPDLSTASGGNDLSGWVVVHELGHSIGGLADEYEYTSDPYTDDEVKERNASIYDSAAMLSLTTKWFRWIGAPSPDGGLVGSFEGAQYGSTKIYRPTENSLMRTLFQPYNLVGTEALVIEFYKRVRPIEASTPTDIPLPGTGTISVTPMRPVGSPLSISWYVDGQYAPAQQNQETFDLTTAAWSKCGDSHTVVVQVVDNTIMVRDPAARDQFMTDSRSWNVAAHFECPYQTYLPSVAK